MNPTALGQVHDLILAQAAVRPHATAVQAGDGEAVDYQTLVCRAVATAVRLTANGVQPDQVVGLSCHRSIDGTVGMLAILIVGAGYLYVDPDLPPARREYMLHECAVRVLLTTAEPSVPDVGRRAVQVCSAGGDTCNTLDGWPHAPSRPHHLAYVVYTSGSTGQPRGVAVEHGGVANMTRQLAAALDVHPGSRVLQFSNWSWDAAACELLVTLTAGATVVLAPESTRRGGTELATFLRAGNITTMTVTPSVLAATPHEHLPRVQTVAAVGEPCPPEVVARWSSPGRRILNGYGLTETTVAVSIGECGPGEQVHIGAPLPGVRVRIVDQHDRPVQAGQPGHLLVGGIGIARGYLEPPPAADHPNPHPTLPSAVTAPRVSVGPGDPARFFRDHEGTRWFRTNDIAYQRPDGTLVYEGRLDDQVQLHGQRIELGEIEATLRRHPTVRDCAAIVHDGCITAYVVGAADLAELAVTARAWLPPHMIPTIHVVDALPMTVNGKLDRTALVRIAHRDDPELSAVTATTLATTPAATDAPADIIAEVLATIRTVLDNHGVGPDDDIFLHGGHSLLAAQLSVALWARYNVDVPALTVVDNPTAAQLASALHTATTGKR